MKRKALLTAIILFTALTSCRNTSNLQCDELYMSDYNCDLQPRILTTPQYPYGSMPVYGTRAYPAYNYGYPYGTYNTIIINNSCDEQNSFPATNRPRPSIYNSGGSQSGNPAVENTQTTIHRKPQQDAPSSRKTRD